MIGMKIQEFIEKAYYGDEVEFVLHDTTYFMQGYKTNDRYVLTVDYWKKTDGSEPEHDYLFQIDCDSQHERMILFESAQIFCGKTIYEVESEITVVYG